MIPSLDGRGSDKSDEISQSMPIPEFKIGWIIGKKGSYIVQLAQKSGAAITVSEGTSKEYGIVWKYVQISGSRRAVDRAKKLLHIRLERFEPRTEMDPPGGMERTNHGFAREGKTASGGEEIIEQSYADPGL